MHVRSVEAYRVALYWNVAVCSLGSRASLFYRTATGWQEKMKNYPKSFEIQPWSCFIGISLSSLSLQWNTEEKPTWRETCSFWCMVLIGSIVSGSVVRQSISIEQYGGTAQLTCGRQQGKEPGVSYHLKSTCPPGLCRPNPNICHFSAI